MQLHAKNSMNIWRAYCGVPHHTIFNPKHAAIWSLKMYVVIRPKIYCLLLSLETQQDVFYQVHIYKLDLSLYLNIYLFIYLFIHSFIHLFIHSFIDPLILRISFDRFIVCSRASTSESAV
jgi:hypothetical protein